MGYGDLTVFKMAALRHLGFLKVQNFNIRYGSEHQRANKLVRHRAKFRDNRSNSCRDMAIFLFSKWQLSAILHF